MIPSKHYILVRYMISFVKYLEKLMKDVLEVK